MNVINYPKSCSGCPNNPKSYEMNELTHKEYIRSLYTKWVSEKVEFDNKYINELGGDEDNTL